MAVAQLVDALFITVGAGSRPRGRVILCLQAEGTGEVDRWLQLLGWFTKLVLKYFVRRNKNWYTNCKLD